MVSRRAKDMTGDSGAAMETCRHESGSFQTATGALVTYERFEAVIPVAGLVCEERVKEACLTCPRHGKNLACPPRSPDLPAFAREKKYARILCIRIPQDQTGRASREEASHEAFDHARDMLVAELMAFRGRGFLIAGSGSCRACGTCAGEMGLDTCPFPGKMIYSLESMGVNVVTLAKNCFGIDLDWSAAGHAATFICAIGAVFF